MGIGTEGNPENSENQDIEENGNNSGSDPVKRGVEGCVDDYRTFVALALIELLVFSVVSVPFVILIVVTLATVVLAPLSILLALVWLVTLGVIHLFFVFTSPAVVIDSVGVRGALRKNFDFMLGRKLDFALYIVLAVAIYSAAGVISGVFNLLSVPRVSSLLLLLGVMPFIDILKTALYAEGINKIEVEGEAGMRQRFKSIFVSGWGYLTGFVRSHPSYVILSLVLFSAGMVAGWEFISGFEFVSEPPENASDIFGTFPVSVFIEIGINNWLVSASQTYSGLAFGIPTAVSLIYNGLIIGIVAGFGLDLDLVAALIVPHGIIEIPALAVSGGVGFHLGVVMWGFVRGGRDAERLAYE
ncbi:MAG: stage II sporulation protein M, partial [Halobacteria archaeon]|nr:stage II sporulation protein M [Halobacteria archaeon]